MNTLTSLLWLLAGCGLGMTHAWHVWRSAQATSVWTGLQGVLRFWLVAALLMIAALQGGILMASLGWAVAFAVSCAGLLLIHRPHSVCRLNRNANGK